MVDFYNVEIVSFIENYKNKESKIISDERKRYYRRKGSSLLHRLGCRCYFYNYWVYRIFRIYGYRLVVYYSWINHNPKHKQSSS
ncbi:hypothetical protein DESC_540025 [Desulfosarcina cetonica]|nr:hypothetical protein DESC_540025 [Desulfosarcina cetonica]